MTGRTYIVVAFLARMPLAMSQLGVLLLVSDATGSFGAGGFCAGALALANAVGAPFWGARADRLGQRRVVAFQSLAGAAGLLGILLVAGAHLPWGAAAVASAVAGVLLPQIGPLARVRWRPITAGSGSRQHRLVDAAFSYEGAADEASFVLGPALIGLGVSAASPTVALALAATGLAVFGTWFALHETATVTHAATIQSSGDVGRLLTPALVVLCLAQLLVGSVFGSVQTGTSVLATTAGSPGLTGYFHALLGVGSVIAGLAVAALPASISLPARLRWFAAGLLVLSAPLLVVGSLAALVPVLLVLGCTVAPYMITTFTLAERVTPASRTGAAMTVLAAATGLGYAVGAAAAGRLADWGGHTPAYAVTVGAGVAAVVVSWGCGRVLTRASTEPSAEQVPTP
nr:MFS transporter [Terrabacter sp. MAHUQ-38]